MTSSPPSPAEAAGGGRRRRLAALALVAGGLILAAHPAGDGWPPGAVPPDVMTLPEAAAFLRASPETVADLAADGRLPAQTIGGDWRFSRSALRDWLAILHPPPPAPPSPVAETPPAPSPARAWLSPPAIPDIPFVAATPAPDRTPPHPRALRPRGAAAPAENDTAGIAPASHAGSDAPDPAGGAAMSRFELAAVRGRGPQSAATDRGGADRGSEERIGEAPTQPAAEEVALRRELVLLKKNEMTLELDLAYTKSDDQSLAVFGGGLQLVPTGGDAFTSVFTARYGLMDDLQIVASNALTYDRNSVSFFTAGGDAQSSSQWTTINSFTFAARYAAIKETSNVPNVIFSLVSQVPVVESTYAVGGRVSFVKSIDPIAVFGDVGYLYNFDREIALPISRNVFAGSIGTAFAVNDTFSLKTRLSGVFTRGTRRDDLSQFESERFFLQLGFTSLLRPGLFIEPTVTFALNGPPSVTVGIALPYTFFP